jgi:hypothetical protein
VKGWHLYWAVWFATAMVTFLVPELYAIFSGNDQNTLSFAVWALEGKTVGNPDPLTWNFAHAAFTSSFIILVVWLIGHFGWGIWR